jgi:hypothetical protein
MQDEHDSPREFRPWAFLLAWMWPGLGHISVGERARGMRIMGGMAAVNGMLNIGVLTALLIETVRALRSRPPH